MSKCIREAFCLARKKQNVISKSSVSIRILSWRVEHSTSTFKCHTVCLCNHNQTIYYIKHTDDYKGDPDATDEIFLCHFTFVSHRQSKVFNSSLTWLNMCKGVNFLYTWYSSTSCCKRIVSFAIPKFYERLIRGIPKFPYHSWFVRSTKDSICFC